MIKIDGLNTEIGLKRVSGSEKAYTEALEAFYNQLAPQSEKLKRFFDEGDTHSFMVLVHGMKSSLSAVGAMELSEKAQRLETASRNNDIVYCGENFPFFLNEIIELSKRLSEIFQKKDKTPKGIQGCHKTLLICIKNALEASDNCDMDKGILETEKLLEFDYGEETDELIEKAHTAFKDFDFDFANDCLNRILKLI